MKLKTFYPGWRLTIWLGWILLAPAAGPAQSAYPLSYKLNQTVEAAKNSTVLLRIKPDPTLPDKPGVIYPQEYRATGVIIEPGLILTNFHILKPGYTKILADNKEVTKIIRYSAQDDLLLMSAATGGRNPAKINFGQQTPLKPRQKVFYVGNPLLYLNYVSFGQIIYLDNKEILTDTFAALGMSGSGLYDLTGNLIGLQRGVRGCCNALAISYQKILPFLKN